MDEDSDGVSVLRSALDQAAFGAAHGDRPPSRLVQGRPDQVWSVVRRLRAHGRFEYTGLDRRPPFSACG